MQISAGAFSENTGFSDVASDAWYYEYVTDCAKFEIVAGYPDGTFKPDNPVTRGEFICMLTKAGDERLIQLSGDGEPYDPNAQNGEYWANPYFRALDKFHVFQGLNISATQESLSAVISRYEMSVMVINFLVSVMWESNVKTDSPETVITDYASIPEAYRADVVQVYGKGIISGYGDGSFGGDGSLTRAQSCVVFKRILWTGERKLASFVDTTVQTVTEKPSTYVPAALQWQNNGWINGYGSASDELREILFGSADKSYFTSSSDSADHMTTVTVPVWKLRGDGSKYSSTAGITVNSAVADDVAAIFTQIYNDPEQFPIESVGGARYTDTMRHSWGCAIDINPYENAECRAYYNDDGSIDSVKQTCGMGWWPLGSGWTAFAGSLSEASAFSIPRGGSVVKAFLDYGWGWAGNGYSVRNGSQKFDYMHFSVAPNGA